MELASGTVESIEHPTDRGCLCSWACISYKVSGYKKQKSLPVSVSKKKKKKTVCVNEVYLLVHSHPK